MVDRSERFRRPRGATQRCVAEKSVHNTGPALSSAKGKEGRQKEGVNRIENSRPVSDSSQDGHGAHGAHDPHREIACDAYRFAADPHLFSTHSRKTPPSAIRRSHFRPWITFCPFSSCDVPSPCSAVSRRQMQGHMHVNHGIDFGTNGRDCRDVECMVLFWILKCHSPNVSSHSKLLYRVSRESPVP